MLYILSCVCEYFLYDTTRMREERSLGLSEDTSENNVVVGRVTVSDTTLTIGTIIHRRPRIGPWWACNWFF